jgi:acyl phosphate:glycerol-3-phosphate acyltransferase
MTGLYIAISLIAAYLLGSIPTAYVVGRFRKDMDIRDVGSKNMGAMNVIYSVGFWWGALVLVVDIMKGVAAMAIADAFNIPELAYYATGVIALLGHNFPIFLKFRGGKGGATAVGVLTYTMFPFGFFIGLGVFVLLLAITRFPTLSYGVGLIGFIFAAWLHYNNWHWVVFSIVLVAIPFIRYIPRVKEIYGKAGNLKNAIRRKSIKDRY